MKNLIWDKCFGHLEQSCKKQKRDQEFDLLIRPLQVEYQNNKLVLLAPNYFIEGLVRKHFYKEICEIIAQLFTNETITIKLDVGSKREPNINNSKKRLVQTVDNSVDKLRYKRYSSRLNKEFTFDNFVRGKSNEFAFAAASQVSLRPGSAYNPLLIYGDVGLGKTHIMHSVGNAIFKANNNAKIICLYSERFVANMIKALQTNTIDEFKHYYSSSDVLLIDDVQFFAGKDRSQEEFFHTFNTLIEDKRQIILTCDRYPKEIKGLKGRLQSRFSWGLTVGIEPPELETRVAILMSKAELMNSVLPYEAAFFIAKRIRSNVRELEGALKRVLANAKFTGRNITVDFVKETLRDLINLQDKLVTIENIQKTVAEYYKIKVSDLSSKRRTRSITRPRQIAMSLSKKLTTRSLPEIGNAFGGRDHSTVLHACRKIEELLKFDRDIKEDHNNLSRILMA